MTGGGRSVVSDSTMYISFLSPREIGDPEALKVLLRTFVFHVGPKILGDMQKHANSLDEICFMDLVKLEDTAKIRYDELMSLFAHGIFKKGEGEAIVIAYHLHILGKLSFLILDDRQPKSFVRNNISVLGGYLSGTVGFLDRCAMDGFLDANFARHILRKIEHAVHNSSQPPFYITPDIWEKEIKPRLWVLRGQS